LIVMTTALLVACLLVAVLFGEVASQGIPISTLKTQAVFSFAAYCEDRINFAWDCYWCRKLPNVRWISNFGVKNSAGFGFIAITGGDTIQITWRGSNNIASWIKNAQFIRKDFPGVPGASVHSGFYNTWNETRVLLESLFRKTVAYCPPCNKVVVSGHSLGGALATITAVNLRQITRLPISLYTFGSPRVGNPKFASFVKSLNFTNEYRVTAARDPVPHLPGNFLGYQHVFREMWSKSTTENILCSNKDSEDPSCSNTVVPLFLISDHMTYMGSTLPAGQQEGCYKSLTADNEVSDFELNELIREQHF